MTNRISCLGRALGLCALSCAAPGAAQDPAVASQRNTQPASEGRAPRPKVRLYTNADLERVHPFAAETGVASVPAVAAADAGPAARPSPEPRRGRGEAYWRAEAARVRERLRALDERAAELRARIAERASQPQAFGRRSQTSGASGAASLRASLAAVERRARLTQEDLEERARRDYALPGWLR